MDEYCMDTFYGPDPQDCGDPAVGTITGTPLCAKHLAAWEWAMAHQEEE
jgi:hypothetical protein